MTDSRWLLQWVLIATIPMVLWTGGLAVLAVIPLLAGCLVNGRSIKANKSFQVVRSQSLLWHQVDGTDVQELTLLDHWLWPHVVLLKWADQQGRQHHRYILRRQLGVAQFSSLVIGLQQDNRHHDKQNSGKSR